MEERKRELQEEFFSALHRFSKLDVTPILEGFSMGEAHLLTVIVCREKEDFIRVSGIAEQMGVSPPAVSRMLKKLEERELVERITDKADRRSVHVVPTAQGRTLAGRLKENMGDFMESVLSQMDMTEYERVIRFLKELYAASEKKMASLREEGRGREKNAPEH